jgi:4-amino-4-deoxy-L-arabinose transferase-like glycosyltransferase
VHVTLNKKTTQTGRSSWQYIREALSTHFLLLGILVGSVLVSLSLGPFSNWDAQLEYGAASSVLQHGLPYMPNGGLINQPPMGYLVDGLFFRVFGLSYSTGVAIVTLFSLGCVVLVYVLGKEVYGEQAGLLAAGLFALSPWQVVLARSFLIDVQCLFFSLLFLLVGFWAIRKNSLKLFLVAGLLFGLAYLTKAFAMFMLLSLALLFLFSWRKVSKPAFAFAAFALPALFLGFLWYEVASGQGFFALLRHDDFTNYLPGGMAPSPLFAADFLLSSGGAGICLALAAGLSVVAAVWQRKHLAKTLRADVTFALSAVFVVGAVTFLGSGLGLVAPFTGTVKYLFQTLPLFCLLAASLPQKLYMAADSAELDGKKRKIALLATSASAVLVVATLVLDAVVLFSFSRQGSVAFSAGGAEFSLLNSSPLQGWGLLAAVQVCGFTLVLLSVLYLLWQNLKLHRKNEAGKKKDVG